jgi:uncharacterized protein YjbI with pentapeptide repeats
MFDIWLIWSQCSLRTMGLLCTETSIKYWTQFTNYKCYKCIWFWGAIAQGAIGQGASVQEANVPRATVRGVICQGAIVRGAIAKEQLSGSNCQGATVGTPCSAYTKPAELIGRHPTFKGPCRWSLVSQVWWRICTHQMSAARCPLTVRWTLRISKL